MDRVNSMNDITEGYIQRFKYRFFEKVEKTDACWRWIGAKWGSKDYGVFTVHERCYFAHRISWIIANGEIPEGLHVLHHCDNRQCVNPKHLFLGNNADNVRDKVSKNRHVFGTYHPRCKLTEDQVKEIRSAKLCRTGPNKLTAQMLAEKYGMSRRAIRSIFYGETWKHLSP